VTVGLVPTMGALHAGHRALLRAARGENDRVVMSLFVNPTQFGKGEDFERYPRDEGRDRAIAAEEGVDEVFAPAVDDMYPSGFATAIDVGPLGSRFEGDWSPALPGRNRQLREHFQRVWERARPCTELRSLQI